MEGKAMFWGVILKPDKRYEQTVEESFHISKACLEPSTAADGKVTTVFLEKDSDEFIICNMKGNLSENLDLNFSFGEKICFRVEGAATVHLTGYLAEDDDFGVDEEDDSRMMGDSMLMEEASDEDEGTPQLVKKRKHAAANGVSPAGQENKKKKVEPSALDKLVEEAKKSKEKQVKRAQSASAALLSSAEKKKAALQDDEEMDEDSDEDEDDVDDSGEGEEEEESDDEMEDEEEEDSDDAGEEEEEVEEKQKPGKKQNLTPKKTPVSSKKDKKTGQAAATPNGAPVPKKPVSTTPKEKGNPETPSSKKKSKEAGATDGKANGVKEGQKTPKRTLKGGLQVEDLKVGNGPEVAAGKFVGMYYEGKLKAGGKTFDSCKQGKPFKFKLGKGEVIKGWDLGVVGMKVGGKRRLTVPPKMAYGSEGAPPDIPPNSVLMFDVECKSVN